MNQFWSGNERERTHKLTTTTTGSKNSQKEANNQTSNQNSVLCPQRSLPYRFLVSDKSSERHTLSYQQAQLKEAETVSLIENDAKSLSRPLAWLL